MIDLFSEIVALMGRSDIHKKWTVEDLGRLIVPPLVDRQLVELRDGGNLVGFATYALLTEEAQQGYVDQTRKLQRGDWNAGDNIWGIDAVAPFGHGSELARKLASTLVEKGFEGQKIRYVRVKDGSRHVTGVTIK